MSAAVISHLSTSYMQALSYSMAIGQYTVSSEVCLCRADQMTLMILLLSKGLWATAAFEAPVADVMLNRFTTLLLTEVMVILAINTYLYSYL